ncbi:MAG: HU family DNA-binding protein [Pseudomonadota bacterium]
MSKSTAAKPALSVVKEGQNANPGQELKKRELLDQIVKRTDVKKKFAKPVMEAMMEVLGEALAQERPLNLQPMGKVMPKRTKEAGTNRVITARIRQSKKAGLSAGQAAGAGNSDPVPGAANPPVAKPAE